MQEPIKTKTLEELQMTAYSLTKDLLGELVECLESDYTIEETCAVVGIAKDTYYRWIKESDEFADKMERAKMKVGIEAKNIIAKAVKDGSSEDAWKYLERRQKKLYSPRTELTGEDGEKLIDTDKEELKSIALSLREMNKNGSTVTPTTDSQTTS